jgi:uncharacterized integral membrane protein (TIGR00698 family)
MMYVPGILLTFILALAAKFAAQLSFLHVMGPLMIAILLGMAWRYVFGVKESAGPGIALSTKVLLRAGIILLGMRLDMRDLANAGAAMVLIAAASVFVTLIVVYALARMWKVDSRISILTACGTAICGAAAVGAIGTQLKARHDEMAVSTAVVALLGTVFTFTYTLIYPVMAMNQRVYGVFSGATLHEIAHVLAAAAPAGAMAVQSAILMKLTRVILLVPVAALIGWLSVRRQEGGEGEKRSWRTLPIPWFIFGFITMSGLHSLQVIPTSIAELTVSVAYLLLGMAMAGLGLGVTIGAFRAYGLRAFAAGLVGSLLLSVLGYVMTMALVGRV